MVVRRARSMFGNRSIHRNKRVAARESGGKATQVLFTFLSLTCIPELGPDLPACASSQIVLQTFLIMLRNQTCAASSSILGCQAIR